MSKPQDDDIDLERAAMDPYYRRRVLRRLKAEAEGRGATGEDFDVPDGSASDGAAAAPRSRR